MEQLVNILHYLKEHPEVTWSGAGVTGIGILYFLLTRLVAPLFRQDRGRAVETAQVRVRQKVQGKNNIVTGIGDVRVERK